MEIHNLDLQKKYALMKQNEVRFEEISCDDAEYILVAYGSSARICQKALKLARQKGIKVGLLRPITLFPFPEKRLSELAVRVKGFLTVECSAGQMVEDVRLSVNGKKPVHFFGRMGGMIPSPDEVLTYLEQNVISK